MATDKKEVRPASKDASKKDVQKKDKAKSASGKKKFNLKKTLVSIGHFFRDVVAELKKVSWASRKEFISYTTAVVVFVIIFGAIIFMMDSILGTGLIANVIGKIGA